MLLEYRQYLFRKGVKTHEISLWSGHDHDNYFHGLFHGIRLGYSRKAGVRGYGSLFPGMRLLEFESTDDPKVSLEFSTNIYIEAQNDQQKLMTVNETAPSSTEHIKGLQWVCGDAGEQTGILKNLLQRYIGVNNFSEIDYEAVSHGDSVIFILGGVLVAFCSFGLLFVMIFGRRFFKERHGYKVV